VGPPLSPFLSFLLEVGTSLHTDFPSVRRSFYSQIGRRYSVCFLLHFLRRKRGFWKIRRAPFPPPPGCEFRQSFSLLCKGEVWRTFLFSFPFFPRPIPHKTDSGRSWSLHQLCPIFPLGWGEALAHDSPFFLTLQRSRALSGSRVFGGQFLYFLPSSTFSIFHGGVCGKPSCLFPPYIQICGLRQLARGITPYPLCIFASSFMPSWR